MMRRFSLLAFVLLSALAPCAAAASDYEVNVTRKASQLYKVTGDDIYIFTRGCYVYAYSEDAILRMTGRLGSIVFLDAGTKCDVKGVYGKIDLSSGTYEVRLTRESDDWYSISGTDMVLKTLACFEYWYGEEVLLRVSGGSISIIDDDGHRNVVEGVFGRLSL